MNIAFLGDIHLRANETLGKRNDAGVSILLQDKLDTIGEFVDYVLSQGNINLVVFLGDIFHNMNPSEWLREKFWQSIKPLIGKVPIRFILGNHDLSIKSINLFEDIQTFGKANQVYYDRKSIRISEDGCNILYAPYKFNISEVSNFKSSEILVTHNAIEGGVVGFYDRPLDDPTYDQDDLQSFTLIISGHYHKPQEFFFKDSEVIYVGSITPIDFAERDEEKRFLVLNTRTMSYESIAFKKYREFIQIDAFQGEDPFDKIRDVRPDLFKGAIVKIKFTGDSIWFDSINHSNILDILYDELKVLDYVIDKSISNSAISTKYDIGDEMSNVDIIKEYSEKEELDEDIQNVGLELFNEAEKNND